MDFATFAYPALAIACLAAIGYCGKSASAYFAAKAASEKNDQVDSALAKITGGLGRIAGSIALDLAPSIGSGVDITTLKNAAIADGVKQIQKNYPDAIDALGANSDILGTMLNGEVGKLVAPSIVHAVVTNAASATAPASQGTDGQAVAAHAISTLGAVAAKAMVAAQASLANASPAAAAAAIGGIADTATAGLLSDELGSDGAALVETTLAAKIASGASGTQVSPSTATVQPGA
jgi:hypothetical protein